MKWILISLLSLLLPVVTQAAVIEIHQVTPKRVILKNTSEHSVELNHWYLINESNQQRFLTRSNGVLQPDQHIIRRLPAGGTTTTLRLVNANGATVDTRTFPTSLTLDVPFTSQAPLGNWTSPYNEACEEASLLMAQHYFDRSSFDANEISNAILTLANWEYHRFGKHEDTSATDTAALARERLGMNAKVSDKVTVERIKRILQAGHLVLAPVYGNALHNPHYRGSLIYHVVLIIGYDENNFIVHDPGTRYGERYRYDQQTLVHAIHDLGHPESTTPHTVKRIVILKSL